jgi:hypothetical protein
MRREQDPGKENEKLTLQQPRQLYRQMNSDDGMTVDDE